MPLKFNPVYSNITMETYDPATLQRDELLDVIEKGILPEEYCTLDDIQCKFGISRNNVTYTLKLLEIKPFGQLKNIKDGKRTKGVAKHVYRVEIYDQIDEYLSNLEGSGESIDEIKKMAMRQLIT